MDYVMRLLYRWLLPRPGAWSPTYTGASYDAYVAFVRVFGPAAMTFVVAAVVAGGFDLPGWAFAAAFALSAGAFVIAFRASVIYARSWDELQRSLLLNAAALAFCAMVGVLFLNAVLQARNVAHLSFWRTGMLAVALFICALSTVRYLVDRGGDA
jgi:hypothetical protein